MRTAPARLAPRPQSSRRVAADDVIFWLYLGALAWVPFWFGSNDPVSWSINAVLFPGLVAAYELVLAMSGRPHPVPIRRIWFPVACFSAVAVWIAVQAATLTPITWHHPIWEMTSTLLGEPVPGSITVNRDQTILASARLGTVTAAFWLALQLCRDGRRARRLLQAVALIGFAYSAYGIFAFYRFPDTILWYPKLYYAESVTSTFINRNTFATYAGLSLTCFLGLAVSAAAKQERREGMILRLAGAVSQMAGPAGLNVAAGALVAAAIVLSGSRGGVGAAILGMVGLALIVALRRSSRGGVALPVFGAFVVVALIAFSFGNFLGQRLFEQGFALEDRLGADILTIRAIQDAPLSGFGYGSFPDVFPMYRDASVSPWPVWDKAHNTFLELAAEIGIPAASLFVVALGWFCARCLVAALGGTGRTTAPLVAVCATLIAGCESIVDFSLQIQAVALTWISLIGAGVAQSMSSGSRPGAADSRGGATVTRKGLGS